MKIFGYNLIKGETYSKFQNQFSQIQKALKESEMLRPDADMHHRSTAESDGARVPLYPVDEYRIWALAKHSDIVTTIIEALKDGIFRRGDEIEEKFEGASEEQRARIALVKRKANDNDQELNDVLDELEDDLDIMNNAYLLAIKDYVFDGEGNILDQFTITREFIRVAPIRMRIIADKQARRGYTENGKAYVSPSDRSRLIDEKTAESLNFRDKKTGKKLQLAYYRGETDYGEYIYYFKDEVLHLSKTPTLLYGYPKLLAAWMKVEALIAQDRFLLLNYRKGRPPRGILAFSTTNYHSARKSWEQLKAETRKDPHGIHPMLIETKDGKQGVEWIEMMKPLADMQFIETRNEMRRAIGALYGVQPIFSSDLGNAGGLNNEGLQISVTNRPILRGQRIYNTKVYPWIMKLLNITDWTWKLAEPEERDETEDARRLGIKIDNAVKMTQMGFDVKFNEEDEEFSYSEVATRPAEQFFPGTSPETQEPRPQQMGGMPSKGFDFVDLEDFRFAKKMGDLIGKAYEVWSDELTKEDSMIIKQDNAVFIAFISKSIFDKTYEGLSKSVSNKINEKILKGISEKTGKKDLVNQIKNLGVDKDQAELIVRTESAVLKNKAREFNFDKATGSSKFRYKWLGPADNRTADVSKEIKSKSVKGMTLNGLKNLVKKTSQKFGFKPDRDWFSHPNQRHSFVRVV